MPFKGILNFPPSYPPIPHKKALIVEPKRFFTQGREKVFREQKASWHPLPSLQGFKTSTELIQYKSYNSTIKKTYIISKMSATKM